MKKKPNNTKVVGRVYELTIQLVQTPVVLNGWYETPEPATIELEGVVENWIEHVAATVDECFTPVDVKVKVKELKGF
jgi:hypothetical protein